MHPRPRICARRPICPSRPRGRRVPLAHPLPQPPRRPAPRRQHAPRAAELGPPYAPPPHVPDDGAGERGGDRGGAGHEEVHAQHDVGQVLDGECDEAHDGSHGARGRERGADVRDAEEEGAEEDHAVDRDACDLRYNVSVTDLGSRRREGRGEGRTMMAALAMASCQARSADLRAYGPDSRSFIVRL